MFNSDIKRAFAKMDTNPTEQFKNHLKARIVPYSAPRFALRPFRAFTLAGATLIVAFGIFTFLNPANVNRAFASAIQNTFAFSVDGYHHIKIQMSMWTGDGDATTESETWTDGTRAIFDFDGTNKGSDYYDKTAGMKCSYLSPESLYGPAQEPSCSTPEFLTKKMTNAHSSVTEDMSIRTIAIEHADDDHGDLYFTWFTPRPLGTTLVNVSTGPYGYEAGTFSGTYSWQNEMGDTVNRVTWFSENMLQTPFSNTSNTSFLVQIKEIAPEDIGSYGPYGGTPISQSQVYLVDTEHMTVTPVNDEWLEQSRTEFNQKLNALTVSTETIQREYESSFQYGIDIGNHLDSYTRISSKQQSEDGKDVEVATYDLGTENPIFINTMQAAHVEFTREVDTNLIRDMKLYSADGTLIYHTQLLAFEELPTAPAGFFTKEAWETHVTTLR